jgi:hypothetical protein
LGLEAGFQRGASLTVLTAQRVEFLGLSAKNTHLTTESKQFGLVALTFRELIQVHGYLGELILGIARFFDLLLERSVVLALSRKGLMLDNQGSH